MSRRPRKKGQNPGEAEEEARRKVLDMLPSNQTSIVWTDLEKQARSQGMSIRTLRKRLDELEQAKVVIRDVDSAARPPRVYYQLKTSEIFRGFIDSRSPEIVDANSLIARIGKIENPKLREEALDTFLESRVNILAMEILRIWDWGTTFTENQRFQSFYRIMNAAFLAPMITNLGRLCGANTDVLPNVFNRLFTLFSEGHTKAEVKLIAIESVDYENKMKQRLP